MEIYRVLSSIMQERNLTVADVARLSGVADSTIRGIVVRKQNKVSLDVAFKLSDGLGVSLEYLNGMPENEKKSSPVNGKDKRFEEIDTIYHNLNDAGQQHLLVDARGLNAMDEYKAGPPESDGESAI